MIIQIFLNTNGKNILIALCIKKQMRSNSPRHLFVIGNQSRQVRLPPWVFSASVSKSLKKCRLTKTWTLPLMVTTLQPLNSFRNNLCCLETEPLLHLDYVLFPNFHSDLNVNGISRILHFIQTLRKMINYWTPFLANLDVKLRDLFTW